LISLHAFFQKSIDFISERLVFWILGATVGANLISGGHIGSATGTLDHNSSFLAVLFVSHSRAILPDYIEQPNGRN
jgi:hypothetical protein